MNPKRRQAFTQTFLNASLDVLPTITRSRALAGIAALFAEVQSVKPLRADGDSTMCGYEQKHSVVFSP